MKEENEYIDRLDRVTSQLYQIKILLLILIVVCVAGFYGIARSLWDDVAGTVTKVCEVPLVIGFLIAPVLLIVWMRALGSVSNTRPKIDEG